ncbi:hypothetical protein EPUL_005946, partial [Erysiphe pulchra]
QLLLDIDFEEASQTALATGRITKKRIQRYKKKTNPINERRLNNFNEAMITSTSEELRNKDFYFDTCASTHMCPNAERFVSPQKCTGFVNPSSGEFMEILGKGT